MMSTKGKVFTSDMIPARTRQRMTREQQVAWADKHTARNRIVAYDGERPLIAEELQARAVAKLSPRARRAVGLLLRMSDADRKEALRAWDAHGKLKLPFRFVE